MVFNSLNLRAREGCAQSGETEKFNKSKLQIRVKANTLQLLFYSKLIKVIGNYCFTHKHKRDDYYVRFTIKRKLFFFFRRSIHLQLNIYWDHFQCRVRNGNRPRLKHFFSRVCTQLWRRWRNPAGAEAHRAAEDLQKQLGRGRVDVMTRPVFKRLLWLMFLFLSFFLSVFFCFW